MCAKNYWFSPYSCFSCYPVSITSHPFIWIRCILLLGNHRVHAQSELKTQGVNFINILQAFFPVDLGWSFWHTAYIVKIKIWVQLLVVYWKSWAQFCKWNWLSQAPCALLQWVGEFDPKSPPGLNFINVLYTAFTLADSESVKKDTDDWTVFFYAFGIYKCKSFTLNVGEIDTVSSMYGTPLNVAKICAGTDSN